MNRDGRDTVFVRTGSRLSTFPDGWTNRWPSGNRRLCSFVPPLLLSLIFDQYIKSVKVTDKRCKGNSVWTNVYGRINLNS